VSIVSYCHLYFTSLNQSEKEYTTKDTTALFNTCKLHFST